MSDCAPLTQMKRNKQANARETRRFLSSQEFPCVVEHRPMRQHQNVNALFLVHCMVSNFTSNTFTLRQRGGRYVQDAEGCVLDRLYETPIFGLRSL